MIKTVLFILALLAFAIYLDNLGGIGPADIRMHDFSGD
jgi:hypothetical protein